MASADLSGARKARSPCSGWSGCRSEVNLILRTPYTILISLLLVAAAYPQSTNRPQPILVDEIGSIRNATRRPANVKPPSVPRPSSSILQVERSTFDLMNAERASRGLPRLGWSEDLAQVARLHSMNMAANSFFSHQGQDGSMVDDRADLFGVRGWRAIGENIAYMRGYKDPEQKAVTSWLNSPSHRRNMLSQQWKEAAIGVAVGDDGAYYFTQVFIHR